MPETSELIKGFYKLTREERLSRVGQICDLTEDEMDILSGKTSFDLDIAENFVENVVGYFPIPIGVATNFVIDGKKVLIPMAVEETSIIAAASANAKWINEKGGEINTSTKGRIIIGQIQIPSVKNREKLKTVVQDNQERLIDVANECFPNLVRRGGGVRNIDVRDVAEMAVLHVQCDPCDAMGANLINQICEILKPHIESLSGEEVGLCILSNLMDGRLACAEITIPDVDPVIGEGIERATLFAMKDPYRACTHNKGVMNGIDPILIATGNDWRAVEAGIHAYAARKTTYKSVTDWWMEGTTLRGRIEVPLAVGTVGGMTRVHPTAKVALKMLQVHKAEGLARICAAVGLVQNLGALKALSTVGIVSGHMKLHATNLAIAAGAEVHEIKYVQKALQDDLDQGKFIGLSKAKEILEVVRERSEVRPMEH